MVVLVYAIGLTVALIAISPAAAFGRAGAAYALGGTLGALATGGAWGYALWREYGNPMFPFYNAIFKSPFHAIDNFSNVAFISSSPVVAVAKYPILWSLGLYPTSEVPFRDARFAVMFALLPIALLVTGYRWWKRNEEKPDERFWFLAAFITISYVTWLWQFGIQRYAFPIELLTALAISMSLQTIVRRQVCAAVAVAAVIMVWTRAPDFGRVPYGPDWFRVEALPTSEPVLYVLFTSAPMADIIPFMPPGDRFVRVDGKMPLTPHRYLGVHVNQNAPR